jgi:hypothetical protein
LKSIKEEDTYNMEANTNALGIKKWLREEG